MAFNSIFAMWVKVAVAGAVQANALTPSTTISHLDGSKPVLPKPAVSPVLLNRSDVGTSSDYPMDAIRKDEQGTVQVWLVVGTDGRVERCGIEKSSGFKALDSQTCSLFLARAQFNAARDRQGHNVSSLTTERFTWMLGPSHSSTASRLTIAIGDQSQVKSCKDEELVDQQWVEGPQRECDRFLSNWSAALIAAEQKSKAKTPLVVLEHGVFADTDKMRPNGGNGPGEVLVWRRSFTVVRAADGTLDRCSIDETFGSLRGADSPCDEVPRVLPVSDASAGNISTPAHYVASLYLKNEPN